MVKFRLPYREDTQFSILMFAVFVIPLAFTWYTYEKFEIPKITLLLICTGWALITAIRRMGGVALPKSVWFSAVAVSLWIFLSALFSGHILNGLFGTYPRFTSSAVFYSTLIIFFLLLLGTLTVEKLRYLLQVLVVDSAIIAVVGIMQSMGVAYYTNLDAPVFQRAPGLLGNPDFSGMFLAVMLPIVLHFFVESRTKKSQVYYGLVVFTLLVSLILFASRGAWLGAVFGLILYGLSQAIYRFSKKSIIFSFLTLVVFVGLWYGSFQQVRPEAIRQNITVADSSVNLRLAAWDVARQAMIKYPIFGTGPGNFQYFFQNVRGKELASQSGVFDDAHNLFLQLGASLGPIFLLGFLIILTVVCLSGLKKAWRLRDPLLLTLCVALIVFLFVSAFTPVSSACFVLFVVLLAGVLVKRLDGQLQQNSVPAESRYRLLQHFCIAVLGTVLVAMGMAFITSEFLFFKGYNDYFSRKYPQALHAMTVAQYINPTNQLNALYLAATQAHVNSAPDEIKSRVDKAIAIYPSDARGYLEGANVTYLLYSTTGQTNFINDSIAYANKAVELDPNNASRYVTLSLFYYGAAKLDEASYYVHYGLTLDKTNVLGWVLLARILQLQGNIAGSKNAIEHAYDLATNNSFLQELYVQSRKVPDANYKTLPIPILYNPEQLE